MTVSSAKGACSSHRNVLVSKVDNQTWFDATLVYIQGITETNKKILNSHNVKVVQKPQLFRLCGIFLPNLRILSRKNNEPTPFILFLAMTVTTNTSDRPNVSLVHV